MTLAALALSDALGHGAAAQSVEVKVVVPKQAVYVIRDVIDQVIDRRVLADVTRDISAAIRESLAGAGDATRDLARTIRESIADAGGLWRMWESAATIWQDRDYRQEQTDRETKTLALGAAGSLTIKNLVGDITVTAGSGRSATVEILRRSRARTDADAKLGLERVKVEVDQRGERVTITTRYPDERRPPYAVSVAYVVTVPAGTHVTAHTMSGSVRIKDVKGDVSVDVASGDATVTGANRVPVVKTLSGTIMLTDIQGDGRMDVSTLSGDITLERIKARQLSTSSLSGDLVVRDVDVDGAEITVTSGDVEFSGALSRSGSYELRSHNGSIRVVIPRGGFELIARTFNGRITSDSSLGIKASATTRTSLRGTVGEGGPSLEVTTFNGSITISRK